MADIFQRFFTREGGVSEGLYASLNCGAGSHDAPEHVAENKRIVAHMFGRPPEYLCTLSQVHSPFALTLHAPIDPAHRPEADAMVTNKPGLILGILTADCAPVLLRDEGAGVIGAAHAGWKGALGGVIRHTVAAMEALGARCEHIQSIIGPCIAQESYEVSEDFKARFVEADPTNDAFFVQKDQPHFDLPAYVASRFLLLGCPLPEILHEDTVTQEDRFFSYRRKTLRGEPDYGRQISTIMLGE
jgi:YfiH family protein